LLSALLEACSFCDAPENRKRLVATLARASYVDAPVDALQRAFSGHFDFGHGHVRAVRDFTVFHRNDANDPSAAKAAWVLQLIRAGGQCKNPAALNFGFARTVFRPDFFDHAVRLRSSTPHIQNHEEKKELTLIQ
jgi:two-component system, oxyanion-binding sensor